MKLSTMLWNGFIRGGEKNGLKFPRGVEGREGFLSTGVAVCGNLDVKKMEKKGVFTCRSERARECRGAVKVR